MDGVVLLNVDDHEPGRYARSRLLLRAGYRVEEAGTGNEALRLVQEARPSLVLLDVNLPDISGLEVCRRIREDPEIAHTPVLQISASAVSHPQQVEGLDNGADVYLTEPVDSEVLLATVRALLRMRKAEEELQRANEALRASKRDLEAANAALQLSNDDLIRFAYAASHDLHEPLRTINSFVTLLKRSYPAQPDSSTEELFGHIERAATRMGVLITALLNYSQVGVQQQPVTAVDTAVVLEQACANLQRSLTESVGSVVTHTPMPIVSGHETPLIQLFQNLISNALKYRSAVRPPRVDVSAEKISNDMWRFAIRDNGVGIEPKYHDMIFGAFKRLHGHDVPGSGIGLATCRRIIEQHGGRIWVESSGSDQGSTFFFTLPGSN